MIVIIVLAVCYSSSNSDIGIVIVLRNRNGLIFAALLSTLRGKLGFKQLEEERGAAARAFARNSGMRFRV